MIEWNSLDWKTEQQAWNFYVRTINDLIEVKPGVVTMISWAGLQEIKRCLMAAWLGRQFKK